MSRSFLNCTVSFFCFFTSLPNKSLYWIYSARSLEVLMGIFDWQGIWAPAFSGDNKVVLHASDLSFSCTNHEFLSRETTKALSHHHSRYWSSTMGVSPDLLVKYTWVQLWFSFWWMLWMHLLQCIKWMICWIVIQ